MNAYRHYERCSPPHRHPHCTPPTLAHHCNTTPANWGQCDDRLVDVVNDGVNVLIWFSINLGATPDGRALITGPATGKDFLDCVATQVRLTFTCKTQSLILYILLNYT